MDPQQRLVPRPRSEAESGRPQTQGCFLGHKPRAQVLETSHDSLLDANLKPEACMTRKPITLEQIPPCWPPGKTESRHAPAGDSLECADGSSNRSTGLSASSAGSADCSILEQALVGSSIAAIVGLSNNDWIQVQSGDIRVSAALLPTKQPKPKNPQGPVATRQAQSLHGHRHLRLCGGGALGPETFLSRSKGRSGHRRDWVDWVAVLSSEVRDKSKDAQNP